MASNGFLKLDGIEGDSSDNNHQKWIEIQAFTWGCSNSATGTGGAGQATIFDFSITKNTDQATPTLFQRCCNGDKSATADVELNSTGSNNWFLKIHFEDVWITGWQTGGQADGSTAVENVTFTAGKCHITEQPPDDTFSNQGPFDGGYDLEAGAPY
jgi:type VI secretion system secreted protein Hcp